MISKAKFVAKYCSQCMLCSDISLSQHADLCYDQMFKKNATEFINSCFPKLLRVDSFNIMDREGEEGALRTIFCSSKVCRNKKKKKKKKHCYYNQIQKCVDKFSLQLQSFGDFKHYTRREEHENFSVKDNVFYLKDKKGNKGKKKNRKNKDRHKKREIKSTFIYGGSDEWKLLIEELMVKEDGHTDK